MSMKLEQGSSLSSIFNVPSLAKQWSEIESSLAGAAAAAHNDINAEAQIGWIEGRVHETRSTQKETELLLVPSSDPTDQEGSKPRALRVFITCPDSPLFVFAINQHVKISLKGARIVDELVLHGSALPPFSLIFNGFVAIQSVRGGVCMPDGVVVDSRPGQKHYEFCRCLDWMFSGVSLSESAGAVSEFKMKPPTTPPFSSPARFMLITPEKDVHHRSGSSNPSISDDEVKSDLEESCTFPAFNTLVEGIMTPLLGIVETAKPPSTTASGDLCVSLTIADASSYATGLGFRVTCFSTRSRLARDLPTPSVDDVILLKSAKINKWPVSNGLIGTVYPNKLDWITYNPKTGVVSVPRHARSEPIDEFYGDVEKRKELFEWFIKSMSLVNMKKMTAKFLAK